MPLLASLRTGLAALCRKFIICIRLPDYAYHQTQNNSSF